MTLTEIKTHIKSVEQYIDKYENLEDIPQVELDLLMEKLRWAYENLYKQNTGTKPSRPAEKSKMEEVKAPGVKTEIQAEPSKEDDLLHIEPPDVENIAEQPAAKQEKVTTVAEKFKITDGFNESMAKSKKPDLASRLQSNPIKDIASAIGLNDRFLFINELFKGDAKKYDHTISILNEAHDFNEAYRYIDENLEWDMENENVLKILDLVRRKHISNSHE